VDIKLLLPVGDQIVVLNCRANTGYETACQLLRSATFVYDKLLVFGLPDKKKPLHWAGVHVTVMKGKVYSGRLIQKDKVQRLITGPDSLGLVFTYDRGY